MNNEKINSLGKILVKYRKLSNFTQQDIADKLCLKLDLIRNIEKNIFPNNIPWVFYNGYIYSYARLVNLSKSKVFFFLKQYSSKDKYCSTQIVKKKFFFNKNKFFFLLTVFILLNSFLFLLVYYSFLKFFF